MTAEERDYWRHRGAKDAGKDRASLFCRASNGRIFGVGGWDYSTLGDDAFRQEAGEAYIAGYLSVFD